MMRAFERTEQLREHALNCTVDNTEWSYLFTKSMVESCDEMSTPYRFGLATADMLKNAVAVIDEGELIVGKPSGRALTKEEQAEWETMLRYSIPAQPRMSGMNSHMEVNNELLLQKGADGLMQEIRERMNKLDLTIPENIEKYDFYRSCIVSLEGMCALSDKYAELAKQQAQACADEARRLELLQIAKNCAHVPRYPARTFYEALQAVSFLTFCMCVYPVSMYQMGHPDRYLIRYYEEDVKKGILTEEKAQELIDCFCILYNEYLPSGLAIGLMVGGYDENHQNVCNALTYLFLKSINHVRMIYPGVGLCYNEDTPDDVLALACDMLSHGNSHPAIFNDQLIIEGLMDYGLPYEEACNYIHSTCVEITPCHSSACWVASPYTNILQILLDVLKEKDDTNYEDIKQAYLKRLAEIIREHAIEQNRMQLERTRHSYNPLTSCFIDDCLEKGMDLEQGGARYNWIMPSFVGLANVADSFTVINKLVFQEKRFTLQELKHMLEQNYEGFEAERAYINNYVPKYGNDDDFADHTVTELSEFIVNECKKYPTFRGGQTVPSLFCWIQHEQLGRTTGASPDGRKSGFPLGDGSGPAQGSEKNGPTATVLSSTKWNHKPFIGGIAVNMKFGKKMFSEQTKEKMMALIKSFIARGGFEVQINVVDKETLEDAVKHPELHKDLVVRIGGYSDFFVRISPQMQAEVIQRTQYDE